jgi:4-amino-4-deoxy-L-arabinose transferase-like glycosyltransferase
MASEPTQDRAWWMAGLGLAALGIAIRVHNAIAYPAGKGFDATANWEYVARLREGLALPAPDAFWAAAHPPLYYWLAAALDALLGRNDLATIVATRLLGSALGLLAIGAAVWLVRRLDPTSPRRAFLAGALLLCLPVHVYMSAMLNEEIVAGALVSLAAAGVALDLSRSEGCDPRRAAAIGVVAGLALLTKLSGALVILAGVAAYALDGWRRGELVPGVSRAAVFGGVAGLVGGWFLARNLLVYGYVYPYQLDVHAVMATMPPGAREWLDYLRVPLATVTLPSPLVPELLRSVWGTTYTTVWFDSHRHFLPRSHPDLLNAAQWLTLLGLLPTAAFAAGLIGALRRRAAGADLMLVLLTGVALLGYTAFTWRNPWFVTVKASYLLGLSLPFAWFASEALTRWTRPGRLSAWLVWLYLGLLLVATVATFWHGLLFAKVDDPGLQWTPILPGDPNPR